MEYVGVIAPLCLGSATFTGPLLSLLSPAKPAIDSLFLSLFHWYRTAEVDKRYQRGSQKCNEDGQKSWIKTEKRWAIGTAAYPYRYWLHASHSEDAFVSWWCSKYLLFQTKHRTRQVLFTNNWNTITMWVHVHVSACTCVSWDCPSLCTCILHVYCQRLQ